jgi:signal transduction histidine kinase
LVDASLGVYFAFYSLSRRMVNAVVEHGTRQTNYILSCMSPQGIALIEFATANVHAFTRPRMSKIDILMVDDQPSRLLTYDAILRELDENLIHANSANEALDCLLKTDVSIVLTDVNMPGLDGYGLADAIREHPRFQNVAIIFISGDCMADTDRLRGYEHGAVDYISVPVVPELLRAKVRVFAELHRKTRKLELLNAEMQRVSGRMIATQDEERRRIARELHDGLGQELSVAKVLVDGICAADRRGRAAEASELLDSCLQQVRSISHLLHPPLLDELGLESAMRWYLEGLTKRSGLQTSLQVHPGEFPRLIPDLENTIYRIIQEALTNSFRHADAHNASVSLTKRGEEVFLAVRDDGKGISDDLVSFRPGSMGVGVAGMRQRVKEFGGQLTLQNAHPGCLVEVVFPCKLAHAHSFSAVAP